MCRILKIANKNAFSHRRSFVRRCFAQSTEKMLRIQQITNVVTSYTHATQEMRNIEWIERWALKECRRVFFVCIICMLNIYRMTSSLSLSQSLLRSFYLVWFRSFDKWLIKRWALFSMHTKIGQATTTNDSKEVIKLVWCWILFICIYMYTSKNAFNIHSMHSILLFLWILLFWLRSTYTATHSVAYWYRYFNVCFSF